MKRSRLRQRRGCRTGSLVHKLCAPASLSFFAHKWVTTCRFTLRVRQIRHSHHREQGLRTAPLKRGSLLLFREIALKIVRCSTPWVVAVMGKRHQDRAVEQPFIHAMHVLRWQTGRSRTHGMGWALGKLGKVRHGCGPNSEPIATRITFWRVVKMVMMMVVMIKVMVITVMMASPIYFHWLWSQHCAKHFTYI